MTFNTIFQRITHTIHLHSCPNPSFAYECREAFAIIQNSTKGYASTCPYPPHSPNYPPQPTHTQPPPPPPPQNLECSFLFWGEGKASIRYTVCSLAAFHPPTVQQKRISPRRNSPLSKLVEYRITITESHLTAELIRANITAQSLAQIASCIQLVG